MDLISDSKAFKEMRSITEQPEPEPEEIEDAPAEGAEAAPAEVEIPELLYFGSKGDVKFYLSVEKDDDSGEVTDVKILDQEEQPLYSFLEQTPEDINDVKAALLDSMEKLGIELISVDVANKFDLFTPPVEEEEDDPEEEADEIDDEPEEFTEEPIESVSVGDSVRLKKTNEGEETTDGAVGKVIGCSESEGTVKVEFKIGEEVSTRDFSLDTLKDSACKLIKKEKVAEKKILEMSEEANKAIETISGVEGYEVEPVPEGTAYIISAPTNPFIFIPGDDGLVQYASVLTEGKVPKDAGDKNPDSLIKELVEKIRATFKTDGLFLGMNEDKYYFYGVGSGQLSVFTEDAKSGISGTMFESAKFDYEALADFGTAMKANVDLVIDEKEAPECDKCGKKHWPFNKCEEKEAAVREKEGKFKEE